ncbi:MAG: hypothetical protein U5J99_01145 [Parvularculaceae bacterium]|nr:hypothetical protein [Parvularculaceae bacterium]
MTHANENRFFAALAAVLLVFVFAGFAPSYYFRADDLSPLSTLFLAHGAVLSSWYVLATTQPLLIVGGRNRLHRLSGFAGLGLAIAVAVSGLAAGADAMARGVGIAGREPQTFFFLSVADASLFVALVGAALLCRHDRSAHKRLMTIASISILFPALGRLAVTLGLDGAVAVIPYAALLASVAMFDAAALGRIHPATIAAGGAALAKITLYLPVGESALWKRAVEISRLSVGG